MKVGVIGTRRRIGCWVQRAYRRVGGTLPSLQDEVLRCVPRLRPRVDRPERARAWASTLSKRRLLVRAVPPFHAAFSRLVGSSISTLVIAGLEGSFGVVAALFLALSMTNRLEAALWTALAVPALVFTELSRSSPEVTVVLRRPRPEYGPIDPGERVVARIGSWSVLGVRKK